MPMFFAVPSTMRMAASMVVAFRSGSLIAAISCGQPLQHSRHISALASSMTSI